MIYMYSDQCWIYTQVSECIVSTRNKIILAHWMIKLPCIMKLDTSMTFTGFSLESFRTNTSSPIAMWSAYLWEKWLMYDTKSVIWYSTWEKYLTTFWTTSKSYCFEVDKLNNILTWHWICHKNSFFHKSDGFQTS